MKELSLDDYLKHEEEEEDYTLIDEEEEEDDEYPLTEEEVDLRPLYREVSPQELLIERENELDDLQNEEIPPPRTNEPLPPPSLPTKWSDFNDKELELYNSALYVYEDALQSGNEKLRISAAKDILSLHSRKEELEAKKDIERERNEKGNTYNQINITVESLQRALQDALYGFQGGYELIEGAHTHERDTGTLQSERGIASPLLLAENVILPVAGIDEYLDEEGNE